jgi:molybdopterin/thiamine biosynthesis adenylyltransferase
VFAPLVGIVGAMQAGEALRLLTGVGRSLAGRLLMLDGRTMEWTQIRVGRHAAYSVCAERPSISRTTTIGPVGETH